MTVPERAAETAEALAEKVREGFTRVVPDHDGQLVIVTGGSAEKVEPFLAELVSRASDRDSWKHTAEELAEDLETLQAVAWTLVKARQPMLLGTKEDDLYYVLCLQDADGHLAAFREKNGEAAGEGKV